MPCMMMSFLVPDPPLPNANCAVHAAMRCTTHNWFCDSPMSYPSDGMCPIGRADAQVDAAFAEIERRLTELEKRLVPPVQS